MDAVIRRCPFLTVVPSVCLQLAGKSSLLSYAQRCPVMMDLASRAPARALSSSASAFKDRPPNDGQLSSIFLKQKSVFLCCFFFSHHFNLDSTPVFCRSEACGQVASRPRNTTCWPGCRHQMPLPGCGDGAEQQQGSKRGQHGAAGGRPGDALCPHR